MELSILPAPPQEYCLHSLLCLHISHAIVRHGILFGNKRETKLLVPYVPLQDIDGMTVMCIVTHRSHPKFAKWKNSLELQGHLQFPLYLLHAYLIFKNNFSKNTAAVLLHPVQRNLHKVGGIEFPM
jgi:hypothetical protein